jgi:transcriptional regulator with XRE-family HTH domain
LTDQAGGSIGIYLARQRRLRGISLDDLAESTKIPRRSLERLEAGAFDGQPDGFSRGFVRTIADALGLDSEDSIMRLLGEPPDADDEIANHRSRNYRWLAIAVGVPIAIGTILAVGWLWERSGLSTGWSDEPEIIYRRDAVRALAQQQAQQQSRRQSQRAGEAGGAREIGVGTVEIERNRDDPSN